MAVSSVECIEPFQPNFGVYFNDTESTIKWLHSAGLLPSTLQCDKCGKPMREVKKKDLEDGVVWQCCSQHTIRTGSVFFHSKLKLQVSTYLIFYFAKDVPAYVASRLLGPSVSYKSIISFFYKLRDICSRKLIQQPLVFNGTEVALLNGEGTVEIDESLFGKKVKSGCGTSCQKYSVFGIVEKRGRHCVFYLVNNRKRTTILPLIQWHIMTNCSINHDGFAVYNELDKEGYEHSTVNHNVEFVTEDGTHTNTIEGLWGLIKQQISQMHGVPLYASLAAHLDEFSYRQIYATSGSIWKQLIQDFSLCDT